ncbi:response regulator transcription factor [Spirosoma harenae]
MSDFTTIDSFYKRIQQPLQPLTGEAGHFNMFRIEDVLSPDHKQANYSRRNFFKISLITGKNRIFYADKTFDIDGTSLVFTDPMVPYLWERITEEQTGYICIFTEAFLNRIGEIKTFPVFQHTELGVVMLPETDVTFFQNLFRRMEEELLGSYIYKYDLIRNLLMEVIHGAQKRHPVEASTVSQSNAAERITTIFRVLLERQFPIDLSNQVIQISTPSGFAQQLNIHVNHLNKALKEQTGQTTIQLINDRILQEAKVLIKTTDWTINEIAWSLGFEEANHFSAFFKKRVGFTPKAFSVD